MWSWISSSILLLSITLHFFSFSDFRSFSHFLLFLSIPPFHLSLLDFSPSGEKCQFKCHSQFIPTLTFTMRGWKVFLNRNTSSSFSLPHVNESNDRVRNVAEDEPRCRHVSYPHLKTENVSFPRDCSDNISDDVSSHSFVQSSSKIESESTSLSILSLSNTSASSSSSTLSSSSTPSPPSSPCISCNKFHAIKSCARKVCAKTSLSSPPSFYRKNVPPENYPKNGYPGITFEDKSKRKKVTDIVLSLLCLLTTAGLVVFILILLPNTSLNKFFNQNNVSSTIRPVRQNTIKIHSNKHNSNKHDRPNSFMAKESVLTARMDLSPKTPPVKNVSSTNALKDSLEREDEPRISYDVIKKLDLHPTIETKSGFVQGTSQMILGKIVSSFLGIPYAKPPLNELRFRKPLPVDPWNEIYDAKEQPPPCVQFIPSSIKTPWISTREHSEDCLYMNIWTPETPIHRIKKRNVKLNESEKDTPTIDEPIFEESSPEAATNREPLSREAERNDQSFKTVMVWFYGGAFFSGSIDLELYDGSYLAAAGDVIVVSVNYRLGALGFLSSPPARNDSGTNQVKPGTLDAPGNMGMYDQVMALNWIKENIDSFGGDPDNIVLFGQSAGATSAGLHLLSPLTREIPSRVILQSGSPLFPKIYFENSIEKSALFALKAGCMDESKLGLSTTGSSPTTTNSSSDHEEYYIKNSIEVVSCLKNLSIDQLQAAHIPLFQMYKIPFFPKPGDEFLPELPHEAIEDIDSLGPQTEILLGNMKDEGSFFLHLFFPDIFKSDPKSSDGSIHPKNGIRNQTRGKAHQSHSYPNITLDQAKYYISQAYSFIPENQAQLMSEFFLLSLNNETSPSSLLKATYDIIGDSGFVCPAVVFSEHLANYNISVYHYLITERPSNSDWDHWMGSTHLDEVQLIFGLPIKYPGNYTQNEIDFSWNLIDTWTTFAKTGWV